MILVTGAGGLLGSHLCARYPKDTLGYSHHEYDIANDDTTLRILSRVRPDVVVNCAGITRPENVNPYQVYLVNTYGPRSIAYWCSELGIRYIHVSTNCVFDGQGDGLYREYDSPDAKDLYGRTKASGEVYSWEYPESLTIRTSFVGWPDPSCRGLLSWLHKQPKNKPVPGFVNVLWNGITVTDLCDYINELAYSRMTGVVHLTGPTLSKYEVLRTIDRVYDWGHEIEPVMEPCENKTLKNTRYKLLNQHSFEDACQIMKESGMREYERTH
jgi:dTDP-4-dehydrorhamnose reductase